MPHFRKKPVVIEAHQWDGTVVRATEIINWIGEADARSARYHDEDNTLQIDTLEVTMAASVGDWIIRGVSNEHYPCKPGIFTETYERVDV